MTHYVARWADGTTVRWRALTWAEYRTYQRRHFRRPLDLQQEVYRAVVIEGPAYDEVPAGVAYYIQQSVLSQNPFSGRYEDLKPAIDTCRQQTASTYLMSARALVAHIFNYSFEEIEKWDAETFFQRLAQAELITGKPLEPVPPKKLKREKKDLFQQEVEQKRQDRRARMTPAQRAVEDRTFDPEAPKLKRELTNAQRMTLDRITKNRRGS